MLKSPKQLPTGTGVSLSGISLNSQGLQNNQASTPYSQLDDADMDFEYPEVEVVPEDQQQSREPTAELPSCSLSTSNPPTRMPCNEGSFSKVDWNAQAEDDNEGLPFHTGRLR
jgi:hypothetical protein